MTLEESHLQIAKELFVHAVNKSGLDANFNYDMAASRSCLAADGFFMNYRCVGAYADKKDSAIESREWCIGIYHYLTNKGQQLGTLSSYDNNELKRVSSLLQGS